MTTQKLRQSIQIVNFSSHSNGCNIQYIIDRQVRSLCCDDIAMLKRLTDIGSIDEGIHPEEWADYNISQWDALNLVIRHEYEKAIEEEVNSSDIGKAINSITNHKK